jgi:uncharacterized protein (DUF1800 family)
MPFLLRTPNGLPDLLGDLTAAVLSALSSSPLRFSDLDAETRLLNSRRFIMERNRMQRGESIGVSQQDLMLMNPRRAFEEDIIRRSVAPISMSPAERAREMFVRFLSNAIPIGVNRSGMHALAIPYEDEAIRPNASKSFRQLLFASTIHPAMLEYLDAGSSVGPNSPASRGGRRGVNENYAREVMELHTLGVDGGYTQDDVRALALALTGFGIERDTGKTMFRMERHEPGPKRFMGREYTQEGQAQAWAMLSFLADHSRTARRFCTRLATHYLGPNPSSRLIDSMVRRWTATHGDMPQVFAVLLRSDEARDMPANRWRSPEEFVTASILACGIPSDEPNLGRTMLGYLRNLGQVPFSAPDPRGYPEDTMRWMSPDQIMDRATTAEAIGNLVVSSARRRNVEPMDPRTISSLYALSQNSAFVVSGAPSLKDGLALVLLSPEFQRR